MICNKCGQQAGPNEKFCRKCGTALFASKNRKDGIVKWFKKHKKASIAGMAILILIIIIIVASANSSSSSATPPISNTSAQASQENSSFPATTTVDQNKIVSSVVNIWCPDNLTPTATGGSGTMWTSGGLVLTNAHIIPQDSNEQPKVSSCTVTISNEQGAIKDVYVGEPIIIPTLSNQYDLAFIKITGPYTDSYGVDHGPYPTTFSAYPDFGCQDSAVTLSEPVTVYGYPGISGNGNSLTLTTGVVSSLPGDGTIVTSAKVAHGNSGGLAVDEYGCMIGVPSMFNADNSESLGIIKDNVTVRSFMDDVQTALKSSDTSTNGQ